MQLTIAERAVARVACVCRCDARHGDSKADWQSCPELFDDVDDWCVESFDAIDGLFNTRSPLLDAVRVHKAGFAIVPCLNCGTDVADVLFEDPYFTPTGGHPGDSGPGGNVPQDPIAEGLQRCPHCEFEWEAAG
jgi:hypothetical protein